jgi:hypothetical protein
MLRPLLTALAVAASLAAASPRAHAADPKPTGVRTIYLIRHGDYDELVNGKPVENPGLSTKGVRQLSGTGDVA